jgi:hypothetical protein
MNLLAILALLVASTILGRGAIFLFPCCLVAALAI